DHFARVDLKADNAEAQLKQLLALARYPNVWIKVSEWTALSPSGKYPFKDTFPLVKRVYDVYGPDRMMSGTGFPGATRAQAGWPSLQQELDLIRQHLSWLSARDREKILGENAARLWKFAK